MKIILQKERAVGWNGFYAGKHWQSRRESVAIIRGLFLEHRMKRQRQGLLPLKNKVSIVITCYFDKSPLDPDNIASKFYIDGMKDWLLIDDDMRYVDSVTTKSRMDKENPRIEIDIYE